MHGRGGGQRLFFPSREGWLGRQATNGIGKQTGVQVKAYGSNVPMLTRAQNLACAADFQVAHGNRKPGS